MMLRSRTESHFLGVSLRTNAGWQRLYAALEQIIDAGFPENLRTQALADLERIKATDILTEADNEAKSSGCIDRSLKCA
ncbi:hypothetical protein [Advenella kashmirensis]|uniref:hypothetical protein n=1 Tax=Advenella kashmirensis TaxID=310575 RepID=UPI002ADE273F|nr:hypothetical protein [Advenella kashmirensis]